MKSFYPFCLSAVFLLMACKNAPPEPPATPYWGDASIKKNGVTWTGLPVAYLDNRLGYGINISFDSLDQFDLLRESCIIYKIPNDTGTYPVVYSDFQKKDSLVGAQFFVTDADVPLGAYDVRTASNFNFITLLSYDTVTREVKGNFGITFYAVHKPYPDAPDTIRLQCSNFHTKVAN